MSVRFMLDTNVISDLIEDPHGKVARKLEAAGKQQYAAVLWSQLSFDTERLNPVLIRCMNE